MDEVEFKRLLDLFPVVRSRDFIFQPVTESSRQSSSRASPSVELNEWHDAWDNGDENRISVEGNDQRDAFWKKLKSAAVRKVGAEEAERFCKSFQRIHNKLVHEELSSDTTKSLIKLLKISDK